MSTIQPIRSIHYHAQEKGDNICGLSEKSRQFAGIHDKGKISLRHCFNFTGKMTAQYLLKDI